jgi:hypothetical protein
MHKTTLKIAFTMLLFAAITSCKKTNKQDTTDSKSATPKMMSATVANRPQFPNLENGTLVFKDQRQFDDYTAYLDKITDPKSYDTATLMRQEFDQDAILGAVESQLGFTSIRKISHDKFMALNAIGWDRLEDIPEEHFIRDAVLRSVLNENLTLKIGTNFVHIINKYLSVKVDATADAKIIQAFSRLPVTASLEDALSIDPLHKYSTLFEVSQTGRSTTFGTSGNKPTGEGDLTILNLKNDANNCSNATVVTFTNAILYQDFGPNSPVNIGPGSSLPATFAIDFGDNTTSFTIHTVNQGTASTPSYVVPAFTHTYPAAGIYRMKMHAVADQVYGGALRTYADRSDDINVGGACKAPDKIEGAEEFFPVPDGSRAVSGKITVTKNYNNFWSNTNTRILAETSSWLRDGNKWKQSKSEIWDKLHADRKDKNCNVIGQTDGDGWSSNSKHISVHRTDPNYYWQKVTTEHGIKYHDIWYTHGKVLNVCQ